MSISDQPPPPVPEHPAADATHVRVAGPNTSLKPTPPPNPFARSEKPDLGWKELLAVVVAGFLLNIGLRVGVIGLASTLGVAVFAGGLWGSGRLKTGSSKVLVLAALALAPWLAIRSSGSLTAATAMAIVLLGTVAVGLSQRGRLFDLPFVAFVAHAGSQVVEWTYGIDMVQRFVRTAAQRGQGTAILRGLLVAVPVVFVFGALLASADDVFASLLLLDNLPSMIGHVLLSALVAVALLGLLSRAAHETAPQEMRIKPSGFAPVEVTIVLGSLAVLFAGFVATQIAVAVGGVDHVLETEGLTQAQHARRGFFQLVWVAALSLAVVGAVRGLRRPLAEGERCRFRPIAIIVLGLTLAIAAVALQRLLLYVGSFDLTPLRLWSIAGVGWVIVVIVAYAVAIAGFAEGRSWFPGFTLVSAAVFVFSMNVMNPDATVARYNLSNAGAEFDAITVARLSNDAVPAIADAFVDLSAGHRGAMLRALCDEPVDELRYGPLGWNLADRQAESELDELCPTPRRTSSSSD